MNAQTPVVESKIYDCIGIGFGPSNMSLAIALEERGLLESCRFLEAADDFHWHPGMMLNGSDIQHNPLRDLVTPRNPSSRYGFLSYLKANDRLFDFLNLAAQFPPRSEYAGYVKWVGDQFRENVELGCRVADISEIKSQTGKPILLVSSAEGRQFYCRTVCVAPGRSPSIPEHFKELLSDNVVHLTDFLPAKRRWLEKHRKPRIAVIGGSQSAIEIILDLADTCDVSGVTRGFAFKQKDLSAFTECIYYPEFVDYFHSADPLSQNRITNELWRSNYGAADSDVIERLNFRLYEQKVRAESHLNILMNQRIQSVCHNTQDGQYTLELADRYSGQIRTISVDGVVLATGFMNFGSGESQEPAHPLLSKFTDRTAMRPDGGIQIDRNYRLQFETTSPVDPAVFVNGLCESSHGFGDAGSFSLLSVRSAEIAQSISAYLAKHSTKSGEQEKVA